MKSKLIKCTYYKMGINIHGKYAQFTNVDKIEYLTKKQILDLNYYGIGGCPTKKWKLDHFNHAFENKSFALITIDFNIVLN